MINSADIIITQIGANCDNIIFCNKSCKFKIIYPFNCKKWARMYLEYPQCELLYCGNQYQNNGDEDRYNWNYTIDFNLFKL
jgi:capsular polysaccharide biosynthesis protein